MKYPRMCGVIASRVSAIATRPLGIYITQLIAHRNTFRGNPYNYNYNTGNTLHQAMAW